MLVTELPMVTEVKSLQYAKALPPMLVTELGMVTEVRQLQPQKAKPPMLVTELGIMTRSEPPRVGKECISLWSSEH